MDKVEKDNLTAFGKSLTALTFDGLLGQGAVDAVNEFTRRRLRLEFTGMPNRGTFAMIMAPREVKTRSEWLALGFKGADLEAVKPGNPDAPPDLCVPWFETGLLFYEIAEARLARLDYEGRLARRQVSRTEWGWRKADGRKERRRAEGGPGVSRSVEDFAYDLMGQILGQLDGLAALKLQGG